MDQLKDIFKPLILKVSEEEARETENRQELHQRKYFVFGKNEYKWRGQWLSGHRCRLTSSRDSELSSGPGLSSGVQFTCSPCFAQL